MLNKLKQLFGNFTTHDGVVVLTYHRINDQLPEGELVVHPREFEIQMKFLNFYRKKFQIISMEEMIEYFVASSVDNRKRKAVRTKILITFDDGYRDNYTHAFPILKKHRFPAAVFLTTDYISTEYKKERYKNAPWSMDYLNYGEIKEMKASGIRFGAHTATHPHLREIDLDEAKKEILKSYESVREISGNDNIPFCYPYGEFNEEIKQIVKKCGFSCAFSVAPGINYRNQDLFEIKRIDVLGGDSFSSFKYKVTDKYKGEKI